ncbi:hypothetical protein VKT23_002396 [Stygiomarasmius scandens]|uniref:EH domain-containing protein n=1 Tax=Marasmiellus scandens TaxID=2682957 RepID=A0ABR1K332_9AGAR
MSFIPTPDEVSLAERILSAQKTPNFLAPDAAVEILADCGLSHEVLAEIWNLADDGPKGYLLAKDVALALRLVGWAQAGENISQDLVGRCGPLAVIKGFSPESSKSASTSVEGKSILYPPMSPGSHDKYNIIFQSAHPRNGVLNDAQVFEVWRKSSLSEKQLSQIWNLVNVDQRNYLDFDSFCLGMYFIQGLLDKQFIDLPDTIPNHLSAELKSKSKSLPSSPTSTLLSPMTSFVDQSLLSELEMKHWILHSSFTTYALERFRYLDTEGQGFVEGDRLVPFLQSSGLSDQELSKIWDLADISRNGKISQYGFTVALFLIHRKLAGFDIPNELPAMSSSPSLPATSGSSDPFRDHNREPPVVQDDNLARVSSPSSPTDVNSTQQILTLQAAAATMRQENDTLRLSLKNMTQSLERQKTLSTSRRHSSLDKDLAEISKLRTELQSRDTLVSRLKASLDSSETLVHENTLLRVKTESLTSQLEVAKADCQVQQILAEEATHEAEELRRQVQELRESTSLPSAGGDEELQMLINEDISRENGRLRNQVKDLQDSLAQLQAVSTELDAHKETERGLVRENRRLKRQLREMEEVVSTSSGFQSRVEELTGENERLRRELRSARENAQRSARGPVRQETDMPPPSYSEVADP